MQHTDPTRDELAHVRTAPASGLADRAELYPVRYGNVTLDRWLAGDGAGQPKNKYLPVR